MIRAYKLPKNRRRQLALQAIEEVLTERNEQLHTLLLTTYFQAPDGGKDAYTLGAYQARLEEQTLLNRVHALLKQFEV